MSLPDMPLGPTDLRRRPLGVGTMRWGEPPDEGTTPTDPASTFEAATTGGISVFDTSEGYLRGASERELGRASAASEAPAFLATKFAPLRMTSAALPRALDASPPPSISP